MRLITHSRIYNAADYAENEKMQKKNFEDIRFPTYMARSNKPCCTESVTGRLTEKGLHDVLIASVTAGSRPAETPAKKREDALTTVAILGPGQ